VNIYTRTGDGGQTGLVGGARISKTSPRIAAIGEVDELNAALGVAVASRLDEDLEAELEWVQNRLFDIGSELAAPKGRDDLPIVGEDDVDRIERSIDRLMASLPPLRQFILPGGTPQSAALHLARCVCRRAERAAFTLARDEPVRAEILQFLNRLADWLFVAARTANNRQNVLDVAWKKR